MAKKAASGLSVADLEQMLAARRSELSELQMRRDSILDELEKVEAEIALIEGGRASSQAAQKNARAKPRGARKQLRKQTRGRRPKNAKPLGEYVVAALSSNKNGLSIQEISDEVRKQGYKTKSSNFKTVVYQFVYHSKKIGRSSKNGNYILK